MATDCRRALVTGGAGFIGSHLAAALVARGARVTVLDDLSTGALTNVPAGVRLSRGGLLDPGLEALFVGSDFDLVIHCAAQTSVARSVADPEADHRVNVEGTERLARLALAHGRPRFVFFSSGGAIYGETPDPAAESTPPAPLSPYGWNKLKAERRLEALGVQPLVIRPSNVYGPRQRADLEGGVVSVFLNRALRGEPLELHGDGEQVRDFVHVSDVVAAVLALLDAGLVGAWNVATGAGATVREVADEVARATGTSAALVSAPRREGDVRRSCLDASVLRRATGWRPRYDLRAGVAATIGEVMRHA